MIVARTTSASDTHELGEALAELVRPSDLILLSGDLGAGKTTFCQGFGRGLGVSEQITSPTFTLARTYSGRLDLHHLDVYRLGSPEEVADLGLNEVLDDGAVTVIEWGDMIAPLVGADRLEIRIHLGEEDDDRVFEVEPAGVWAARDRVLRSALSRWLADEVPPC
jgi:tRNA threonylcarbamoyladenosine biosynthesis protein TsaE